ncbi:ATP synthase subunit I [Motiliproteus sp.]|uniref:ATP synthase subunit I n=1 Tax=Motiliproteus sp. TaxID=1898955 RepID=UPI003BAC31CF
MGQANNPNNKGLTTQKQRTQIRALMLSQIVLTVIASAIIWLSAGTVAGYSALLGGLIYLIPFMYQAQRVLKADPRTGLRQSVRELYKSEIWKMALTMVLFGSVFSLVRPLEPFSLFGVFILMQLISWLAPLLQNQKLLKN